MYLGLEYPVQLGTETTSDLAAWYQAAWYFEEEACPLLCAFDYDLAGGAPLLSGYGQRQRFAALRIRECGFSNVMTYEGRHNMRDVGVNKGCRVWRLHNGMYCLYLFAQSCYPETYF